MSTMPTGGYADYDLENQQLERRRKMAEMLSMNAQKPYAAGSMVGNVYVPTHWTQHAAQALNGYASDKEMERLDARQMDVARRKQDDMRSEGSKFAELLRGKPATEQTHTADDQLAYGGAPSDSVDTQVKTPAVAGDRNAAMAFALGAKNPMLQQAGYAEMLKTPESQFAKLNPKDYTPESLRRFAASGSKDFSLLENRKNLHFADVGNGIVGMNPETGAPSTPMMNKGMSPDAYARLQQQQYQFDNLSAADLQRIKIEAQKLGISAQDHFFNTGMQAPGAPALPQNAPPPQFGSPQGMPQGMPQAGMPQRPMPQGVPAPGTGMRAPGVGQAPQGSSKAILEGELSDVSNRLAQAIAKGDTANADRLRVDIQSLQRELGMKSPQGAPQAPQGMPQGAPVLSPKNQQALALENAKAAQESARTFPQVEQTAKNMSAQIDALIGDLGRTLPKDAIPRKPHAGFESAVGATYLPGARFVPGTDAKDFATRLEQIQGGTFLQAFESLKGGGQITEIEGAKATAALNRMGLAQSEREFVTAAREFQENLEKGVKLAAQKAGKSYSSPQAAPQQSGAPVPAGYRPL